MKKIPYRCPYLDHTSCDKVDPNGRLWIGCEECNHYDKGIVETGALSFKLPEILSKLFKYGRKV